MSLLYHESQVAALCGVHALNTLLQGPVFTEIHLAQVAQELDALEQALMQESGGMVSEDYIKFAAEGSGNVGNDGMFSIQVLSKALMVWGLQANSLDSPEMADAAKEPSNENAFICNLQEHWFTIRKIDGEWWNFNSLFPAPQPVSQFYLSAFLSSLKEQGYMIFVIRGSLPASDPVATAGSAGDGRWFTPDEAKAANDEAAVVRQRGKVANVVENALSRAAAAGGTMQLKPKRRMAEEAGDDDDADLAAAIAASLGHTGAGTSGASSMAAGVPSSMAFPASHESIQPAPGVSQNFLDEEYEEDPELAAAIAASMADSTAMAAAAAVLTASAVPKPVEETLNPEPPPGPGVVELRFRLPTGGAPASRRFPVSAAMTQLYSFVRTLGIQSTFLLSTVMPRKDLAADGAITLEMAGIIDPQVLTVTKQL